MPDNTPFNVSDELIEHMVRLVAKAGSILNTLYCDLEGDLNRYKDEYREDISTWQQDYNRFFAELNAGGEESGDRVPADEDCEPED